MNPTFRWLARRLALTVFVIFGVATATFCTMRLIPGDPAATILGVTLPGPDALERIRGDLGLDQPFLTQFGAFLGRLVRGDLGISYQLQQPVGSLIAEQLPATIVLAVTAFALAFVLALGSAVATAGRRPVLRRLLVSVELVLSASPPFWLGVLLLTVFSFRFGLVPAAGGDGLAGIALPAVTLALSVVGMLTQVLREAMERALGEAFVVSSRARGSGENQVRVRHVLRHALIPVATLSGWIMGNLFGGAVVIETVFSRQGIGRVLVTAIEHRDLPVVTGIVIVAAGLVTLLSLGVDLLHRVLDPRIVGAVR